MSRHCAFYYWLPIVNKVTMAEWRPSLCLNCNHLLFEVNHVDKECIVFYFMLAASTSKNKRFWFTELMSKCKLCSDLASIISEMGWNAGKTQIIMWLVVFVSIRVNQTARKKPFSPTSPCWPRFPICQCLDHISHDLSYPCTCSSVF